LKAIDPGILTTTPPLACGSAMAAEPTDGAAPPLVSICIPAYKGAASIAATIESVLAQSCADFELIVCDDRSPDDTAAVVQRYTADPRVRLHVNPHNLGAQGNWNRCLELARGRYYKLLPQDDLLAPGALQEQVQVLQADHEGRLAIVFGWRQVIDGRGRPLMKRGLPGAGRGAVEGGELVRRCVRAGTNLVGEPGNGLMRLALARQIGPYDPAQAFLVDLDYWFRALCLGDAYYTATQSSSFRVSTGAWSTAIGKRQYAEFRAFIATAPAVRRHVHSRADIALGLVRARLQMLLRLVLYRFMR
jgi:glycosyltransferase involved in cell wall biosynthesis